MNIVITRLMMLLLTAGAVGSGVINVLWGGWSQPMTVLCILMGLDYVSGILVALVFRRSPKTESGGASSLIGLKGLLRKIFLIFVVAAGYQLDAAIGTAYIRDAVALTFIANEALSIIENAGLMGIPIPKALMRGIDVLNGKAESGITHDKPDEAAESKEEKNDLTPEEADCHIIIRNPELHKSGAKHDKPPDEAGVEMRGENETEDETDE